MLGTTLPLAGCGGEGDGSTVRNLNPEPDTTSAPQGTSQAPGQDLFAPSSGAPTAGTGGTTTTATPPASTHDSSPCGGCTASGLLRCDQATLECVECLVAEDCAYGSQQQCVDGWCTNPDVTVTPCPAQRVVHGDGCGLSGYTCIYGTEGRYTCRCGDGAAAGATTYEATVWTCTAE